MYEYYEAEEAVLDQLSPAPDVRVAVSVNAGSNVATGSFNNLNALTGSNYRLLFVYLLYQSCNPTPLLLDTDGDGFRLTGPAAGVRFDFSGKGKLTRTGWTAAGSDDAFLALDRNDNGQIDDGTELFGNHALQPSRGKLPKNGFHALAEFDKADNGGNGDRVISAGDAVFGSLLLWTDKNHNGLSEPDELRPYADAGATAISLTMWPTKVADAHGNWFQWVSRLEGRGPRHG